MWRIQGFLQKKNSPTRKLWCNSLRCKSWLLTIQGINHWCLLYLRVGISSHLNIIDIFHQTLYSMAYSVYLFFSFFFKNPNKSCRKIRIDKDIGVLDGIALTRKKTPDEYGTQRRNLSSCKLVLLAQTADSKLNFGRDLTLLRLFQSNEENVRPEGH